MRIFCFALLMCVFASPVLATGKGPLSGIKRVKNSILGHVGLPGGSDQVARFHVYNATPDSEKVSAAMANLNSFMPLVDDNVSTLVAIEEATEGDAFAVGVSAAPPYWTALKMPSAATRSIAAGLFATGHDSGVDDHLLRAALWCPLAGGKSNLQDSRRLAILGACKALAETLVKRGLDQLPTRDALVALSGTDIANAWAHGEGSAASIILISHEVANK